MPDRIRKRRLPISASYDGVGPSCAVQIYATCLSARRSFATGPDLSRLVRRPQVRSQLDSPYVNALSQITWMTVTVAALRTYLGIGEETADVIAGGARGELVEHVADVRPRVETVPGRTRADAQQY